jgi:ribosomal protein L18E
MKENIVISREVKDLGATFKMIQIAAWQWMETVVSTILKLIALHMMVFYAHKIQPTQEI